MGNILRACACERRRARASCARIGAHACACVCARVWGGRTRQRTGKEGKGGRKRRRKPIRGMKSEGIFEKILWIENLSLCLQCSNKWRLGSEKSWEPQKKRGFYKVTLLQTPLLKIPLFFLFCKQVFVSVNIFEQGICKNGNFVKALICRK